MNSELFGLCAWFVLWMIAEGLNAGMIAQEVEQLSLLSIQRMTGNTEILCARHIWSGNVDQNATGLQKCPFTRCAVMFSFVYKSMTFYTSCWMQCAESPCHHGSPKAEQWRAESMERLRHVGLRKFLDEGHIRCWLRVNWQTWLTMPGDNVLTWLAVHYTVFLYFEICVCVCVCVWGFSQSHSISQQRTVWLFFSVCWRLFLYHAADWWGSSLHKKREGESDLRPWPAVHQIASGGGAADKSRSFMKNVPAISI